MPDKRRAASAQPKRNRFDAVESLVVGIAVTLGVTAVAAYRAVAWAQSPAAATTLPVGSPITIVADETVDPRVRPGSEFRAHLRDPLELGTTLVATGGTPAKLVVTAKDVATDGTPRYHIAITGLNLGLAGTLPVRPNSPTIDRIAAGMPIPATTLAAVGFDAGKVRVAVPLPFKLSNEPPNGGYTPTPLRTAAPIINRRKPTATPAPAPSGSPAAPTIAPTTATSATPAAQASGSPAAAPLPAPT